MRCRLFGYLDTDSSASGGRKTQESLKGYTAPRYRILTPAQAAAAIRSITSVLERVDRRRLVSPTPDISLTLHAARELERFLCGDKTEICDSRMEKVYFRVLCCGVRQLPYLDHDLNAWSSRSDRHAA
jgi:hypothetical protein